MKIILEPHAEDISNHARLMLRAIHKDDMENPRDAKPRVASVNAAVYPHTCDDCGGTYWDRDEWGHSHIGCDNGNKKMGF